MDKDELLRSAAQRDERAATSLRVPSLYQLRFSEQEHFCVTIIGDSGRCKDCPSQLQCTHLRDHFQSTTNSKRRVSTFLFWKNKLGRAFPISDDMLGKNVWGKLSSCDHGIKEGNGQRKVQNGAICVNPYHYAPIEILSLVRPLVDVLNVLDYTNDDVVWRCLQNLGWNGSDFVGSPGDFATANSHFDQLCLRVRHLTDNSAMAVQHTQAARDALVKASLQFNMTAASIKDEPSPFSSAALNFGLSPQPQAPLTYPMTFPSMFSAAGSSQRVVPSSQPYSQVSSPASYGVPSPQSLQVPMFGGQLNIPSPQTSYGSVSPQHSYLPSSSASDHLLESSPISSASAPSPVPSGGGSDSGYQTDDLIADLFALQEKQWGPSDLSEIYQLQAVLQGDLQGELRQADESYEALSLQWMQQETQLQTLPPPQRVQLQSAVSMLANTAMQQQQYCAGLQSVANKAQAPQLDQRNWLPFLMADTSDSPLLEIMSGVQVPPASTYFELEQMVPGLAAAVTTPLSPNAALGYGQMGSSNTQSRVERAPSDHPTAVASPSRVPRDQDADVHRVYCRRCQAFYFELRFTGVCPSRHTEVHGEPVSRTAAHRVGKLQLSAPDLEPGTVVALLPAAGNDTLIAPLTAANAAQATAIGVLAKGKYQRTMVCLSGRVKVRIVGPVVHRGLVFAQASTGPVQGAATLHPTDNGPAPLLLGMVSDRAAAARLANAAPTDVNHVVCVIGVSQAGADTKASRNLAICVHKELTARLRDLSAQNTDVAAQLAQLSLSQDETPARKEQARLPGHGPEWLLPPPSWQFLDAPREGDILAIVPVAQTARVLAVTPDGAATSAAGGFGPAAQFRVTRVTGDSLTCQSLLDSRMHLRVNGQQLDARGGPTAHLRLRPTELLGVFTAGDTRDLMLLVYVHPDRPDAAAAATAPAPAPATSAPPTRPPPPRPAAAAQQSGSFSSSASFKVSPPRAKLPPAAKALASDSNTA